MARYRYQALIPGTPWFVGYNPDGSRRYHTFTPADSRRYAAAGNAMLRAGLNVPAAWEHQDRQKPRPLSRDDWVAERTKGTAGWAERFLVSKSTGILHVDVEIPDPADGAAAERVRFSSPEIDVFEDGGGRPWGEVITHLALTPRPVQHGQRPILRLGRGPMRLSVDPYRGGDMADEKKEKKDGEKKDGEGGETASLAAIIEALRETGKFVIPDEVTDEAGLIIAIKASSGAADPEADLDPDLEEVQPGTGGGGDAGPMLMSLQTKLVDRERKDLVRRLDGLLKTGRCSAAEHKAKAAELKTVRLSLDDKGEVQASALAMWVESREALPKGSVFPLKNGQNGKRLSHGADEVSPPRETQGAAPTPEENEAAKAAAKKEASRVSRAP